MKKRIGLLLIVSLAIVLPTFFVIKLPKIQAALDVHIPSYRKPPSEPVSAEQGWTPELRTRFHYTPQGTQIMPLTWFLALEQPCLWPRCGKFADPAYLARFGFLSSPKDPQWNPAGLPVGFAVEKDFRNPVTRSTYTAVGFTCATCHTGELQYQGHVVRIEGGPAMVNLGEFLKATSAAVGMTSLMPLRYARFEKGVLGPHAAADQKAALRQQFDNFLQAGLAETNAGIEHGVSNSSEGFGRTDALARIGNVVFGTDMQNWDNVAPNQAPVRFPQIWDASWFTWVQYNASISNPMSRNIGEALGVKAVAKLYGASAGMLQTSVPYQNIWDLEMMLRGEAPYTGLNSPRWPAVFPPLDKAKVARGRDLYTQRCQECHLAPLDELKELLSAGKQPWVKRDSNQPHPFLEVNDWIPMEYVGTDPNQALDFYDRVADTGDLKKGALRADQGLDFLGKHMALQFYEEENARAKALCRPDEACPLPFPPEVQREWSGWQDPEAVGIRRTRVYRPRPLNGAWALGTYLHNGSVPNLFELLSPVGERTTEFWTGSKEFDPIKVGYKHDKFPGAFRYDVRAPGNSNRGHEFRDGPRRGDGVIGTALSPDERYAIIEFLKSM